MTDPARHPGPRAGAEPPRSTTLTIDRIAISPWNVRTNVDDANATEALERSILADGLLNPIAVHPLADGEHTTAMTYGAFAGGRRYRAIRALIARGDLPGDWPVKVIVHTGLSEAALIERSTAENLIRRELRDYEIFAAIARAHRRGDAPARIAEALGQDLATVKQWLRLGNLARPVFDALAAGRISVEQARAYGATEDQALQAETFAALDRLPDYARTPHEIRRAMKVGDAEAARLLRFVGVDAYRTAGGAFELDLFADGEDERGRVVDEALLRTLVNEQLANAREDVRAATGRPDLRFVAEPPQGEFGTDWTLQLTPKRAAAASGPNSLVLPDGDIVAWIKVAADGDLEVAYFWSSHAAKHGAKHGSDKPAVATPALRPGAAIADSYSPVARKADAAIKAEAGLGQDAIQILRSLRHQILRGLLLEDAEAGGEVAQDYLVWAQLRMMIGHAPTSAAGMSRLPTSTIGAIELAEKARHQLAATPAFAALAAAIQELSAQSFLTGEDLAAAFLDYQSSPPRLKRIAAAIVAGLALERSLNAPGYVVPAHDAVADACGAADPGAIRRHWAPTAEFLDLFPKSERLTLAERYVGPNHARRYAKLKSDDLTAELLALAPPAWVHPLLAFDPPGDGGEVEVSSAPETAELEFVQ